MKVRALDTIRVSSAGGRKEPDEEFEISDHEGAQLVARGLVAEITGSETTDPVAAPKTKAARAPRNKVK